MYRWVLALHIISVIAWMAGILYLIRLFVYHAAEKEPVVRERFAVMEKRLSRYIMMPAMTAALVFGVWMLTLNPVLLKMGWMHSKLMLVVFLIAVSHFTIPWRKALEAGTSKRSDKFFRIWNEVPTLLMILIVILAIVKPF